MDQSDSQEHKSLLRQASDALAPTQFQDEAYSLMAGTVKAAATFMPGKLGFWASAAIFAADEVKPDEASWTDAGLGAAKGVATRALTLRMLGSGVNPAFAGVGISAGSRAIDSALSSRNYYDANGNFSVSTAFDRIGSRVFDKRALAADAVVGAISFPLMKASGRLFDGNSFRQTVGTGFVTGYAGGLYEELQRQSASGTGELNFERLAAMPFLRAVSSAVATAPGAQRQYAAEYPWKQAGVTREMEYKMVSISRDDVARVARGEADVNVRPMMQDGTLGTAETVHLSKQTVPVDWISGARNLLRNRGEQPLEQIRYMSRPLGVEGSSWNMVIQPSLKTLPEAVRGAPSGYYQKSDVLPKVTNFMEPTVKYLGSGAESGAFLLGNGTVLKLSSVSGDVAKRTADFGMSPLDARMTAGTVNLGKIDQYRNLAAYTQEFVKAPVTVAQAAKLRDEAPEHGWYFSDYNKYIRDDQVSWATDQAGVNAQGKVVFVDYGARTPKYGWKPPQNSAE